ncbi:hypothetical protein K432DRAFT_387324 [Lepidopterella palustris CBS 459.81]|uniref:Uncharacterized protein n=1 Tax=Lepidopterella palustris CBS 459.81 TaxID=1314670 RepID=A0A8E2J8S3_9PEZI|nr:hypothetical protein K432DRAFT_387324 [Lepidopterella palustris CBS 459.81]
MHLQARRHFTGGVRGGHHHHHHHHHRRRRRLTNFTAASRNAFHFLLCRPRAKWLELGAIFMGGSKVHCVELVQLPQHV